MDWLAATSQRYRKTEEEPVQIDLIEEARLLISTWEAEKKTAEYNYAYYNGAIAGVNMYIERLGNPVRESHVQGNKSQGETESSTDKTGA